MLTYDQLSALEPDERLYYEAIEDEDEKASFEYFYGYAHGSTEKVVISNKEAELYRQTTDSITLKAVCELVDFIPHRGQQPIVYSLDKQKDIYNSYVIAAGRRFGKSSQLSVITIRELLVPFSGTILVCPTFSNAKIIFTEVLKLVHKLGLPIAQMNKGQFNFTLENGARFTANSAANIESALGGNFSLCLYEEFQSIANGAEIHKQMIAPTMLDFGTRESGILYARQFFIGTSRGMDNQLYDYFIKEEVLPNWKSITAPSMTNPTLPAEFFEQMRLELGDMLYRQEILAEFIGSDDGVFHAFNKEVNTFNDDTPGAEFNEHSLYIDGIDIGWSDSTANVMIYRNADAYYVRYAYQKNRTTTADHVANYRELEAKMQGTCDARYCDPSAAQTINDYISTYDYDVLPAQNDRAPSIAYINQLFAVQGVNERPRLFIHEELRELIRQVQRVQYKPNVSKTSSDPFVKDPDGTHWDLIAALRYALYSDRFNTSDIIGFAADR